MTKYLWAVVIVSVSTFNIYAEENSFALEEKFQQIDKDTDDLLDSLKKMYSERNEKTHMQILISPRKKKTLVADDNRTNMNISEEEHMMIMMSPKTEKSHVSDENETAFRKAIEEQESLTKEVEEERLEKVKQEKAKIEEEKAKLEQIKKEAKSLEAEKKKEKEQQELEKEKESETPIEKTLQEKEDDAIVELEREGKVKLEQIETESKLLESEKKKEKESENPRAKILQEKEDAAIEEIEREDNTKEAKDTSGYIVNINMAEEEKNALKDADDALLKAMQEVDEN